LAISRTATDQVAIYAWLETTPAWTAGVGIFAQDAMLRYSNSDDFEDFLTRTGTVVARRTVEVRKPRDIGDAIRAVREARGMSQDELAQANAYDRFYLNGLESGRSTMYITRLLRTLKSLGITLSVTFDLDRPADADRGSGG
jgi:ribosome-binding protein aMBF1 (putative translation factor)